MRNVQFILGGFFSLVFLLFTYWQFNDPDPILWVPVYATAVYTALQAMRGKTNPELLIVLFCLSVFAGLQ
ncbi:MAG: hypothetical protein KGM03_02680, partial [Cytophagales bacterium]|nr:hypothetical protein [Cytophagales bacterium]